MIHELSADKMIITNKYTLKKEKGLFYFRNKQFILVIYLSFLLHCAPQGSDKGTSAPTQLKTNTLRRIDKPATNLVSDPNTKAVAPSSEVSSASQAATNPVDTTSATSATSTTSATSAISATSNSQISSSEDSSDSNTTNVSTASTDSADDTLSCDTDTDQDGAMDCMDEWPYNSNCYENCDTSSSSEDNANSLDSNTDDLEEVDEDTDDDGVPDDYDCDPDDTTLWEDDDDWGDYTDELNDDSTTEDHYMTYGSDEDGDGICDGLQIFYDEPIKIQVSIDGDWYDLVAVKSSLNWQVWSNYDDSYSSKTGGYWVFSFKNTSSTSNDIPITSSQAYLYQDDIKTEDAKGYSMFESGNDELYLKGTLSTRDALSILSTPEVSDTSDWTTSTFTMQQEKNTSGSNNEGFLGYKDLSNKHHKIEVKRSSGSSFRIIKCTKADENINCDDSASGVD